MWPNRQEAGYALEELLKELFRLSDIEYNPSFNQPTVCLKEYYPLALQLFSKPNQPITLAFLQAFPTLDHLSPAGPEELAAFFKRHRYPRPKQTTLLLQAPQRSGAIAIHYLGPDHLRYVDPSPDLLSRDLLGCPGPPQSGRLVTIVFTVDPLDIEGL